MMDPTDRLILDGAREIPEPVTLPAPGASYYGDHRRNGRDHATAIRLARREIRQAFETASVAASKV